MRNEKRVNPIHPTIEKMLEYLAEASTDVNTIAPLDQRELEAKEKVVAQIERHLINKGLAYTLDG